MNTIPKFAFALIGFTVTLIASTPKVQYGEVPLHFEPNQGQAGSPALYVARGDGYRVTVDAKGSSQILLRRGPQSAVISSSLVGGNSKPPMEALDRLPGISSSFRGQDPSKWITAIPNFARVRAASVYPGIDMIYYGNQRALEYDFVVAPRADARVIRIRFDGVGALRIDAAGNLVLVTPSGEMVEKKPLIYQQTADGGRRAIDGRYVLRGHQTVAFDIEAYDHGRPLVIDPVLSYSSFLGGSGSDEGHAVAADLAGHMFITGVTYSTQGGDGDVLVRKLSLDGSTYLYTADLGGSGNDIGNGIAVDASGSAYVAGRTSSLDFPVSNAYQSTNFGTVNAFVLRLDPSGTLLRFSTYLGGSVDDRAFALALDNQGNAYVGGASTSPDFPVSNGAFQTQNFGGKDGFVTKFDPTGNPFFSTLIGGRNDDQIFAIAVDLSGNSYITGQTRSDDYPQAYPPLQHSRHGGFDAFITEITADGAALVYSTFAGGGGDDSGQAIAVDQAGYAYVAGITSSDDFPTTAFAFQPGYAGGASDMFVLAYTPGGVNLLFSTFLGSHGTDEAFGIALDSSNNVYLTGDSNSDQFPITTDASQPNRYGLFDAVVAVLDRSGSQLLYSTFLGGSGDDSGLAIALDSYYDIYLTGTTSSADFPIFSDSPQQQYGGGSADAFVAKIGFLGGPFSGVSRKAPAEKPIVAAPGGERRRR